MTKVMKLDGRIGAVAAAVLLAGAALMPGRAQAHSDLSVQLSWGYPVVVYRETPHYHDTHAHYPRYDAYGRPVVVYRYVDRRHDHHRHHRGHGHHRHGRHCEH